MNGLIIRDAALQDLNAMSKLSMQSKQSNGYDDKFMKACRDELTVTPNDLVENHYWVAHSDKICGCAALKTRQARSEGIVHAFFVDPDVQGMGIGRTLWQQVLNTALSKRFIRLSLDADPHAVGFYEKLGFKVICYVPSGSIKVRTLPHMVLHLRS